MSDAYDMIDRFLRNNLGSDDDYAEYSKALDSLCCAQPAQAGQEQVKCYEVVHGTTHNVVRECELPEGVHNALMRAVASSGKKVERPAQAGQVLTDDDIDAAWRSVPEDTSPEDMEEAISRAIERAVLAKRVPMPPEDWSVFNSGAEVASGLTWAEAWDYMTPSRIERGWTAVCVANKSNIGIGGEKGGA